MARTHLLWVMAVAALAGCGGSESSAREAVSEPEAQPSSSVFEPMTSTIDRAQGVQRTVDDQAAEQRRRIEDAER